ncbi:MAG: transglutaminase domain-containing protein [Hyphomicrobiaceae bacterium]
MEHFLKHSALTDPGKHASAIAALQGDVASLLAMTRGHFVHESALGLYGVATGDFPAWSRDTLSLEKRLSRILAASDEPLSVARPVRHRQVGTCRDFAVMLCGCLRSRSVPARVRCGFAGYFSAGRFEDHWICEHWLAEQKRWARADAQLDTAHCKHLGIVFDTADMPQGVFKTAAEAWRSCRAGEADPDHFGHGEAVGEQFLLINLARDFLSLNGQETSHWDGWRAAIPLSHSVSDTDRRMCNALAEEIELSEANPASTRAMSCPEPFWK